MADAKAGYLGGAELDGVTKVLIYEVPATVKAASFTVSFCNKGPQDAAVYLAHGPGPDVTAQGTRHWEYNAIVKNGTPLERTALVLNAGRKLFAWSDRAGVDVSVHGFEKG